MKRLILWLALLLPFFANAQVNGTIQKVIPTGVIRGNFGSSGVNELARKDSLDTKANKNLNNVTEVIFNEGNGSDSVVVIRDGKLYKIAGSAISSVGFLTYVFSRTASDISGYEQMPALTSYTIGSADTATVAATTTPAIIQEFATNTGFPNTTLIPAGVFNVTYQTQKNSGSQSYYTYAIIYKRNLAGTETAIATTNNSSSVSANTVQTVNVSAVSPSDISLLTTDRVVVKVFAVMVSGTANISIYYDDATDSRLAFPSALVDATNFVPYNGAVKDLVSAFSITGDSIKRIGGTGAQFLMANGSTQDTTTIQTVSNFFPKGDTRYYTKSQADVNYIKNQFDSPQTADFWITGQGAFGGGLTVGNNSVFSRTLGVGGVISNDNTPTGIINTDSILVKDDATNTIRRISPTAFLTPTGSGSGLSGVVLTTTNQTIAGNKTFTDDVNITGTDGVPSLIVTASGSVSRAISASTSGSSSIAIIADGFGGASGIIASAGNGAYGVQGNNTGSGWGGGFTSVSGPAIAAVSTSGVGGTFQSGSANIAEFYGSGATLKATIAQSGSISSTPQGTLYGTATGSITSSQLATSLSDETGTGSAVFSASPTFSGTVSMAALTGTSATFTDGSQGLIIRPYTGGTGVGAIYSSTVTPGNTNYSFATSSTFTILRGGLNGYIRFDAGGAERGQFTSGGFFKASNDGTYLNSSGVYHELRSNQNGNNIVNITHTGTNPFGIYVLHDVVTNNASSYFYSASEASNTRFSVYTNGGIANYSANNVNLSDERVKKNIVKAGSYWEIIKAIEFDKFQYKKQNAEDKRKLLGVMAQQVESVYPDWVSNSGSFGKTSDGSNLKAVYEQQLQYGVNIVVQESMKRIEALEAEIKLLKSK